MIWWDATIWYTNGKDFEFTICAFNLINNWLALEAGGEVRKFLFIHKRNCRVKGFAYREKVSTKADIVYRKVSISFFLDHKINWFSVDLHEIFLEVIVTVLFLRNL